MGHPSFCGSVENEGRQQRTSPPPAAKDNNQKGDGNRRMSKWQLSATALGYLLPTSR